MKDNLNYMIRKIELTVFLILFITNLINSQTNPPDDPINPTTMKNMLGRGFDVSWAEFNNMWEGYGVDEVIAIKEKGFSNVRIRTGLPADETLLLHLDRIIKDCFEHGLIPVLAYNARDYEENPTQQNLRSDSLWWATVADHFKNTSHKLAFNLNIEWSKGAGKDANLVNNWYKVITPGIRASNPTRILIYSPIKLSSPEYLTQLKIPASAGTFIMAEWHLYAAGPSDDPSSPKYWSTGTYEQRKVITDEINIGAAWEAQTGIKTWVGAWMAGNYNKGNTFSVIRQAEFATFMVSEFKRVGVPWSINAMHHFYDHDENKWIDSMLVVLNVLSPLQSNMPEMINHTGIKIKGNRIVFDQAQNRTILVWGLNGKLENEIITNQDDYEICEPGLLPGIYVIQVKEQSKLVFTSKFFLSH